MDWVEEVKTFWKEKHSTCTLTEELWEVCVGNQVKCKQQPFKNIPLKWTKERFVAMEFNWVHWGSEKQIEYVLLSSATKI